MSPKQEIKRRRELVYEMRVSAVMTRELVTVAPEASMTELREILRTKRISGTPVVSEGQLVGIISVEDFINWLAEGAHKTTIGERMTREVETACQDEPLINVVKKLEARGGFGRFPVIERATGQLVGVVTKGDIIAGLLDKLEIERHEEEIRRYRASHIFEDIIADRTTLIFQYSVVGKDFEKAGSGATRLKKTLGRLGVDPRVLRRIAIIAYEAEMNIVIYTDGGEILAKVEPGIITIVAQDTGPGIPDVAKALIPGFSTASDWVREMGFGAGMGLPNIKECADGMNLNSTVGKGTRLEAQISAEVTPT